MRSVRARIAFLAAGPAFFTRSTATTTKKIDCQMISLVSGRNFFGALWQSSTVPPCSIVSRHSASNFPSSSPLVVVAGVVPDSVWAETDAPRPTSTHTTTATIAAAAA